MEAAAAYYVPVPLVENSQDLMWRSIHEQRLCGFDTSQFPVASVVNFEQVLYVIVAVKGLDTPIRKLAAVYALYLPVRCDVHVASLEYDPAEEMHRLDY